MRSFKILRSNLLTKHACREFYFIVGYKLFEKSQLSCTIRLEDSLQFGLSSFNNAAVCLCFSFSQCSNQSEAKNGTTFHAFSWYVEKWFLKFVIFTVNTYIHNSFGQPYYIICNIYCKINNYQFLVHSYLRYFNVFSSMFSNKCNCQLI